MQIATPNTYRQNACVCLYTFGGGKAMANVFESQVDVVVFLLMGKSYEEIFPLLWIAAIEI